MNRRTLLIALAGLGAPLVAQAEEKTNEPEKSCFRIYSIDPRMVAKTKEIMATGYEKQRADIMGSVWLSLEESAKLRALLKTALTDSTSFPMCGHAPAYVIVQYEAGQPTRSVSVCSLCRTWCGADGALRSFDSAKVMPELNRALPLPAAFSKVEKLPDLMLLGSEKSFLELPSPP